MTNEEKEAYESLIKARFSHEDALRLSESAVKLAEAGRITKDSGTRIGKALKNILKRI